MFIPPEFQKEIFNLYPTAYSECPLGCLIHLIHLKPHSGCFFQISSFCSISLLRWQFCFSSCSGQKQSNPPPLPQHPKSNSLANSTGSTINLHTVSASIWPLLNLSMYHPGQVIVATCLNFCNGLLPHLLPSVLSLFCLMPTN